MLNCNTYPSISVVSLFIQTLYSHLHYPLKEIRESLHISFLHTRAHTHAYFHRAPIHGIAVCFIKAVYTSYKSLLTRRHKEREYFCSPTLTSQDHSILASRVFVTNSLFFLCHSYLQRHRKNRKAAM